MDKETYSKTVEELNLNISNHAMERYCERVIGNSDSIDDTTKEKYTLEIKKLFLSSELIYSGIIGHSANEVDVYINKKGWTLLLGKGQNVLITLYKCDLDVGDEELNKSFISKSLAKIHACLDELNEIKAQVEEAKSLSLEEINNNSALIKELQCQLDALKNRNIALNDLIKTEDSKIYLGKVKLRNAVEAYVVRDKFVIDGAERRK